MNHARAHVTFCQLSKILSGRDELTSADYTSKVDEKQLWMCGRSASPQCPRLKFTVVGLLDRLAHHTSQLCEFTCRKCVVELNRAVDASRMKSDPNCKGMHFVHNTLSTCIQK